MKRPNCFVLRNCLFVCITAIGTGYFVGSFNGVLEMDSFKLHFSSLYNESGRPDVLFPPANWTNQLNESEPHLMFCGSAENVTSNSCGSGDNTDSASLIGLVVSVSGLGATFGALISSWLSDFLSRKYGMTLSSALFVVGGTISAFSFNGHEWMLLLGRVFSGTGFGMFYAVSPVYLSESTPKDWRGLLLSTVFPGYTFGIFLGLILNIGWAEFDLGWRLSIGGTAVAGLVGVVFSLILPHSPRWLVKKKRDKEALVVLTRINLHYAEEDKTELQLEELKESVRSTAVNKVELVKELFQCKYIYRALVMTVIFFLEANGVFTVYYASTLFCEVGVSPFISAMVIGLLTLLGSIATVIFVDSIGRKPLFLSCIFLDITTALAVAILTQVCSSSSGVVGYVIVVLIGLFTLGFFGAWQTVPWLIVSEIFPTKIRGLVTGFATSFFWFSTFVMNLLTPIILSSPLRVHGFMYIIAGLNLLGFIIILLAIPETKSVSLEDVDRLFQTPLVCCSNKSFEEKAHCKENGVHDIKITEFECYETTI